MWDAAAALGLPTGVTALLLAAAAALALSTVVRGILMLGGAATGARERWRSLATWWLLLAVLASMLILGRPAVVVVMAGVSLLLLRETLSLTGTGSWWPPGVAVTLAAYAWAALHWRSLFLGALPVVLLAALVVASAWRLTAPSGRFHRIGAFALALLVAVVGPAHVVAVASVAPAGSPAGPISWLAVLLLLTELNDIGQAWCGRAVGRHPMTPVLSPNKTWEGLAGGLLLTAALATLIIPVAVVGVDGSAFGGVPGPTGRIPGPSWLGSAGLGLVVGLAGTAGDLTGSALKRAAGVKDSGDLLPGHGGVLDRFDSLVLSAPAFFAVIHLPAGVP